MLQRPRQSHVVLPGVFSAPFFFFPVPSCPTEFKEVLKKDLVLIDFYATWCGKSALLCIPAAHTAGCFRTGRIQRGQVVFRRYLLFNVL